MCLIGHGDSRPSSRASNVGLAEDGGIGLSSGEAGLSGRRRSIDLSRLLIGDLFRVSAAREAAPHKALA